MTALDLEVVRNGSRITVRLSGEFDISGVRPFHRAVADVEAAPQETLVVDLRDLTFIGAAGLRSLIELHLRSRRDGFSLEVVKGPPLVQRVFALTGVDQRLTMRDDAGA